MKKQSGFTLIELMVVMAIIAILATAGLSAYTGYIKKARDTTRIEDVNAINTIILGSLSTTGSPPADMTSVVTAANNGQMITDPLGTAEVCLTDTAGTTTGACGYTYSLCDDEAGYLVTAKFESKSNTVRYTTTGDAPEGYHRGSCTAGATLVGGGSGGGDTCTISSPIGTDCGNGTIYVSASLRTTPSDEGSMTQSDAIAYCSGKGSGWRLPNISELKQMCNDGINFTGSYHFSITIWGSNPALRETLLSNCGSTGGNPAQSYPVRCVKDV